MLKYGINLKFETIVHFFGKITQRPLMQIFMDASSIDLPRHNLGKARG